MIRRVTTRRVRSAGLLVLLAGLALGGCSSPNREAGKLGVRVCIVNESMSTATVLFTQRDTARGEGSVAPGNQACGEGTTAFGNAVEASATMVSPPMNLGVQAINEVLSYPRATINVNGEGCTVAKGSEGTGVVYDDGVLRYTVQRLADGQWKEFTITFTESVQPSGRLDACFWDSP